MMGNESGNEVHANTSPVQKHGGTSVYEKRHFKMTSPVRINLSMYFPFEYSCGFFCGAGSERSRGRI